MLKESVRIIGGQWRHRMLCFPKNPKIRPTPNRVRETLFNWLIPKIENAVCLDMFAGSGSLGFEALSRGAKWVTFVDQSRCITQYLKKQILTFNTSARAAVHYDSVYNLNANTIQNEMSSPSHIDLIFLDPPFNSTHLEKGLYWLNIQDTLLHQKTWVYLEYDAKFMLPQILKEHWVVLKQKQASNVMYGIWTKKF